MDARKVSRDLGRFGLIFVPSYTLVKRPLPPSEAEKKTSNINQRDEHHLCTKVLLLHVCLIFAQLLVF